MSSPAATLDAPPVTRPTPARDPLSTRVLTLAVGVLVAGNLVAGGAGIVHSVRSEWPFLLFWLALILVINLLPVTVGENELTLDVALLLAVGIIYSPEIAACLALIGAIDVREIRGKVTLTRALFNRLQVGLSILLAAMSFHAVSDGLTQAGKAVLGTLLALVVDYIVNSILVTAYISLRERRAPLRVLSALRVGTPLEFLGIYLGYGALALVVAELFTRVGAWSILTLMVPIIVARQALQKGQELLGAYGRLHVLERLVGRMNEKLVEERRDERVRVAAELHDDTLQGVTSIFLSSRRLISLDSETSLEMRDELERLAFLSEQAMESVRQVITDLRQSPLGRRGLVPTLENLVRDLRLEMALKVSFRKPRKPVHLDPRLQVVIYQVAREALLNAAKHSDCDSVTLSLEAFEESSTVVLEVEDDGTGFDPDSVDPNSHFGLNLMNERVRVVSGELKLASEKRKGTRLTVRFPIQQP